MSLTSSTTLDGANTPWPCNCNDKCNLRDEIMEFCKWISPTKEETMMRESVIVRISCVVSTLWPQVQVKTYGSYATQLYLPNSDIDLCVIGAPPNEQSLYVLAEALRSKDISTSLQVIPNAKVPIVKLTDKVSGAVVDISINHDTRTNQLVSDYTSRYPELRTLTLVLKYFLYQRKLHETYNGGLSSYSLIVVIISFFQFHVPLKVSSNGCMSPTYQQDVGDLLLKFFKFFGNTFDYEHMGLSINNNGGIFPKASRNWFDPYNPFHMSIESPFEPEIDLGRSMWASAQVRNAFEQAHKLLTENPRLGSILSLDPALVSRRRQIRALYRRRPTPVPPPSPFLSQLLEQQQHQPLHHALSADSPPYESPTTSRGSSPTTTPPSTTPPPVHPTPTPAHVNAHTQTSPPTSTHTPTPSQVLHPISAPPPVHVQTTPTPTHHTSISTPTVVSRATMSKRSNSFSQRTTPVSSELSEATSTTDRNTTHPQQNQQNHTRPRRNSRPRSNSEGSNKRKWPNKKHPNNAGPPHQQANAAHNKHNHHPQQQYHPVNNTNLAAVPQPPPPPPSPSLPPTTTSPTPQQHSNSNKNNPANTNAKEESLSSTASSSYSINGTPHHTTPTHRNQTYIPVSNQSHNQNPNPNNNNNYNQYQNPSPTAAIHNNLFLKKVLVMKPKS